MIKSLCSAAIFLSLGSGLFSQSFDKKKLDQYFQALEENNKFMGSVAVSKNGALIYSGSFGFADVENKKRASQQSKYRIGSISKSFTAVLTFQAVEARKISLDQTIDTWFPGLVNAGKITINHLLRHRSGLVNFTNDPDYLTYNTLPRTEKEMTEIIEKGGSEFEPDSKASYSNSNYVLLTYILEKIYQTSYAELLQKNIVKPLGLSNTYVFGKINSENDECKSYRFLGTWKLESETDFSIPLGAGAIISTTHDLILFAEALFGGKLLNAEGLEMMKTLKEGYGLGLFQIPFYNSIGYGHTGQIDGFSSVFAHFTVDKISYALISNGVNMNTNDISIAVLSAVFLKPYEIPTFATHSLTPEDLDLYRGVYASKQIPLKITITKEGNTLIAQATGQPPFPLDAKAKDQFEFVPAGAKFEFNVKENKMTLFQGGGRFEFTRE